MFYYISHITLIYLEYFKIALLSLKSRKIFIICYFFYSDSSGETSNKIIPTATPQELFSMELVNKTIKAEIRSILRIIWYKPRRKPNTKLK